MSDYRIQIVHTREPDRPAVGWQPGDHVESELIDDFCARLKGKKVGWFHSEAKTLKAIKETWRELLLELKLRI